MNQKNGSLFFSIIGHLLLLMLIAIQFNFSVKKINCGELQSALPSYIYQENTPEKRIKNDESVEKSRKKAPQLSADVRSLIEEKKLYFSANTQKSDMEKKEKIPSSRAMLNVGNGVPLPELIALLHAAIQKQQQYPVNALKMEREGSTTVMFILYPNGIIKNLRIVKASGTDDLDQAAIAAVNNAIPIKGVEKYLIKPAEYQITVGFELT